MNKVHAWFGGKTHFIVWVCLFLGAIGYGLSLYRHDSTALSSYLTFLVSMSGVQGLRSAAEDFKKQ